MFYLSTQHGIVQWDECQGKRQSVGLEGEPVYQMVVSGGHIAAVGEGAQVWERNGGEWIATSVADNVSVESLLAIEDVLYVGTEPTRVFRKRFGEKTWTLVGALDELPLSEDFHTPWGGPAAVRTMAATSPHQFYLDIHVGGIVRTRDGGATWETVNDGLEEDVHQVATHPLKPERIYAATADGFYLSEDEGATWERRNRGMTNLYCRGIATHPQNPDIILLSGSPFAPPGWRRNGPQFALFRSADAGRNWERIRSGVPDPFPDVVDTCCIAFSQRNPDYVLCASGSVLYASEDAGVTWEQVADDLPEVEAICAE